MSPLEAEQPCSKFCVLHLFSWFGRGWLTRRYCCCLANVFGCDLSAQTALQGRSVPVVVEKCIEAVEARGMSHEGIYRKSGGAAQMKSIQVAFDRGEAIDLNNEEEYNDICAVTSVLKQFFRELPNPLLTYELYEKFIDVARK